MAIEFYFCARKTFTKKSRAKAIVYWEKPEVNWFKLNIDGSSIGNLGKAGEGGLIRDHKGNWISRFSHREATSIDAELWALRDELHRCMELNIQAMEVELDAKVMVDWVGGSNCPNNSHSSLIADCKYLFN